MLCMYTASHRTVQHCTALYSTALQCFFLRSYLSFFILKGPKLRVGVFAKDKVILVDGQTFTFDMSEEPGDSYRVRLPHPEILNTLRVGDFLLLGT
jgi:hypothetical protein